MKGFLKTAGSALALCAMAGQAMAAGVCAKPGDALALKTAAMQQELMVAALYCNDVGLYNRFVVSYQHELQDEDATLLNYFQQGHGGSSAYHSYKTGLANDFSLSGLHGMQNFCAAANASFDAALNPEGARSLAMFISAQSIRGSDTYTACDTSEASASGGEMVAGGGTRLASNRRN